MKYIELNESGFAAESGYFRCHICHPETGEYMGESDEFISQYTGLPGWAFTDGPQGHVASEMVWVRCAEGWEQVADHRGKLAYDTETHDASQIEKLGELPDGKTLQPPCSPFDRWDGQSWVKNEAAEQQAELDAVMAEQATRIANANQQIVIIKPAVEGGYAKPEHTQLLADWQRYRYELTMVPEQAGWPGSPKWPEQPESII
ncbi:tail fiber assembly protein [Aeromonas hydrophila]|uniref:tail fiber assembly protein n=1 Tax=Aeromonas hydrophila TaxID=644 RepID=UPI0009542437|nr:tail fiber assembly protein [Aeromonas hydrophila]SIR10129.1 virus tail fibre assembly protein, lambda gpK [Aeromonas hydrophila]SIR18066.1 virus tail fibre assembly protein, lambda gpK [Aeromonas hydrophila]